MTDVLRALIPAMWLLWLAYWVLAKRNHKATLRQESPMSRVSHYGPLVYRAEVPALIPFVV
jgi:hypothetical protein